MYHILCVFLLAVLHSAYAQNCIPNPVTVLELDVNGTLYWRPSTNCAGTEYIIYIIDTENEQYYYETANTYFDIRHLPACVNHHFIVVAIANTILSTEQRLTARTPVNPERGTPTITHFAATPQGNGIVLEWDVDPEFAHCVEYYRVAVWDRDYDPQDRYPISKRLVLDDLVPCTSYEFAVTSIYNNHMEGNIKVIEYVAPEAVAPMPALVSVSTRPTYVYTYWKLPDYSITRCVIRSIVADGSPYFNFTTPVYDDSTRATILVRVDSLRPDSMYQLRVILVNSAGASPAVPIAIQTDSN